jgi:hypothetical protein
VSTEAFLVCMSHALTTEKEEVMGLLLGDIKVRLHHLFLYFIYIYIFFLHFTPMLILSPFNHKRNQHAVPSPLSRTCRCSPGALTPRLYIYSFITLFIIYYLLFIYYSLICEKRSDKRKDRVEIEPAQLTAAAAEAEVPLAPTCTVCVCVFAATLSSQRLPFRSRSSCH